MIVLVSLIVLQKELFFAYCIPTSVFIQICIVVFKEVLVFSSAGGSNPHSFVLVP